MRESSDLYQKLLGAGVKKSYASEISRGIRKPGRKLALQLYEKTGEKLGELDGLSAGEIRVLKRIAERAE